MVDSRSHFVPEKVESEGDRRPRRGGRYAKLAWVYSSYSLHITWFEKPHARAGLKIE